MKNLPDIVVIERFFTSFKITNNSSRIYPIMHRVVTDKKSFQLEPNETLLEALERTGHKIEYQCRQGYCGLCRVKLLSGSVSYPEPPMVFLLSDEILPCCCKVEEDITISNAFNSDDLTGTLFE